MSKHEVCCVAFKVSNSSSHDEFSVIFTDPAHCYNTRSSRKFSQPRASRESKWLANSFHFIVPRLLKELQDIFSLQIPLIRFLRRSIFFFRAVNKRYVYMLVCVCMCIDCVYFYYVSFSLYFLYFYRHQYLVVVFVFKTTIKLIWFDWYCLLVLCYQCILSVCYLCAISVGMMCLFSLILFHYCQYFVSKWQ